MRVPAAAVGASWWLLAAAACCCSLLRLFAAAAAAAAVAALVDVSPLMESAGVDRWLWLPETITERAFRLRDGSCGQWNRSKYGQFQLPARAGPDRISQLSAS